MARIFITGSSDGLGRAAARSLIDQGHQVVLHGRNAERADRLAEIMPDSLAIVTGDLSSIVQTIGVADQVNAIGHMDAVIHNAGIYESPTRGDTMEGHPAILAINTLAPYILSALIERPARLVYLSSRLHHGGEGSLADLDWCARAWDPAKAYAESKLHVAAMSRALSRRWTGTLCNAVDPGWVRTKMGGPNAALDIDTGQRTQVWLATSEDPEAQVSGCYWHDLRTEEPANEALDNAFQDRLLARLATLTGIALP